LLTSLIGAYTGSVMGTFLNLKPRHI
jgi:hypothetical protein